MKMTYAMAHPLVVASFLFWMLILTMCTMNPVMIGISLVFSIVYSQIVSERMNWRFLLYSAIPIFVFTMVILPLFSHNGVTPLFYINNMAVTMETIVFGFVMSIMVLSMIQWLQVWNVWIDGERFIYLFGRISPTLALMISMVIRFIPMFLRRYREIHEIQVGMGYSKENASFGDKARMFGKELSILVSWTLEHSVDTSMSMESRGYGLGKRTSFHLFRWKKSDTVCMLIQVLLAAVVITGIWMEKFTMYYFPKMWLKPFDGFSILCLVCFVMLAIVPFVIEGKELLCRRLNGNR
ncbi:MAG: energy-coupling factor transporter transmembrane protein EcfT [Lachnospiraceae bacterium]|nr:energy-coupling factor transporter transmembrane protein EcfT [Lachnospiraceae bacterium]